MSVLRLVNLSKLLENLLLVDAESGGMVSQYVDENDGFYLEWGTGSVYCSPVYSNKALAVLWPNGSILLPMDQEWLCIDDVCHKNCCREFRAYQMLDAKGVRVLYDH